MKGAKTLVNTDRQEKLLKELGNRENKDKTGLEISKIAGITQPYYYKLLKTPKFQDAIKVYCASLTIANAPAVINAFIATGKKGEYQQGRTSLQMSGLLEEAPLIQVTQTLLQDKGLDEAEIDKKIASYFANVSDGEIKDDIVNRSTPQSSEDERGEALDGKGHTHSQSDKA